MKFLPRNDGRRIVVIAAMTVFALFVAGSALVGYHRMLGVLGVPTAWKPCADMIIFSSAQEELTRGGNPYLPIASDPWKRAYNYPPLWLAFMRFPARFAPVAGALAAGIWFCAMLKVAGPLSRKQGLLFALVVVSPSVVFALERGNSDLLVYVVVAFAVIAVVRDRIAIATGALVLAFALKLYPLAALASLLRLKRKAAISWLALALMGAGIVSWIQFDEIRAAVHATPTGTIYSYGSTMAVRTLHFIASGGRFDPAANKELFVPAMASAALAALAAAAWGKWRSRGSISPADEDLSLTGFRAGAAIYCLTFVGGAHFTYRHVFLLLCVPWLARQGADFLRVRTAAVFVLVVCCWMSPQWNSWLLVPREIAGWTLLLLLAWLLGATLPRLSEPTSVGARRLLSHDEVNPSQSGPQ